jgi:hypothetical protein
MIRQFCENTIPHQDMDEPRNGDVYSVKRRSVSNKDLTYRPPLSAKVTRAKTKVLEITDVVPYSVLHPEDITKLGNMITRPAQAPNDVVRVSQAASPTTFDQQLCLPQEGRGSNPRTVPLDQNTGQAATLDENVESAVVKGGFTSGGNKAAEQQRLSFVTPLLQQARRAFIVPSRQIQSAASLDPAKAADRAKIRTSAESVASSSGSTISPSLTETTSLMDMILEAVRIIHQFSKYPHGVPRAVHSRILQSLGKNFPKGSDASRLNQWSDGSMWMQVLEMGSSENQRVTKRRDSPRTITVDLLAATDIELLCELSPVSATI